MIHDERDNPEWSDIGDWEAGPYETGDVVIGPGYGSFRTMVVVHEISISGVEYIVHRGVFWTHEEAERYAEDLHERTPLEQSGAGES